jgi:hypothetical protein
MWLLYKGTDSKGKDSKGKDITRIDSPRARAIGHCQARHNEEDGGRREMCRNIKTLFNFDPPVTPEEVQAASLQFVRKISGFHKPSKGNEELFLAAVDEIAEVSTRLLRGLATVAPPKNREEEAAKAKARAAERFAS